LKNTQTRGKQRVAINGPMKMGVCDLIISNMFQTSLIERALDASVMRNDAISQNIANVDTPNYKKKVVRFEEVFNDVAGIKGRVTDRRHIPTGDAYHGLDTPQLEQQNRWGVARLDQNDVDINVEMAEMAKNTIKYNALIQRLNGSLSKLKSVINDGRR
jgi:flagellar basal-body rod protein FlgB